MEEINVPKSTVKRRSLPWLASAIPWALARVAGPVKRQRGRTRSWLIPVLNLPPSDVISPCLDLLVRYRERDASTASLLVGLNVEPLSPGVLL